MTFPTYYCITMTTIKALNICFGVEKQIQFVPVERLMTITYFMTRKLVLKPTDFLKSCKRLSVEFLLFIL